MPDQLQDLNMVAPRWGPRAVTSWSLVAWHKRPSDAISFVAPVHYVLLQFTPVRDRGTALGSDRLSRYRAARGALEVIPFGADHKAEWTGGKDVAFFGLRPDSVAAIGEREFGVSGTSLHAPRLGTTDPQVLRLSLMMRDHFRTGGCMTELYADSLSSLLAIHLLRTYSPICGRPDAARGGLSWRSRKAVLDLMHERVQGSVTVLELAIAARLSVSHFMRAFKQEFGRTPHQHLLDMRVEQAGRLIARGGHTLAEVALLSGFSSQSHMTAAFRQARALTPGQFRRTLLAG